MDLICITQSPETCEIKASQYKHLPLISETLLLPVNLMKTYRLLHLKPPGTV